MGAIPMENHLVFKANSRFIEYNTPTPLQAHKHCTDVKYAGVLVFHGKKHNKKRHQTVAGTRRVG